MIQLRELYLNGWLSYDEATITLDTPGITRIAGKMGSGKSAILEAIVYLVTGKTIRAKSGVSDLCNQVLDNGYNISITLTKDASEVIITEIRNRSDSGLYFIVDGEDRRGKTNPETRSKILSFLDITPDEFKSINVIGQRQAHLLVEGTPTERAHIIVDVFNLDKYDAFITLCKNAIADTVKEFEEIDTSIVQKKEELANTTSMIKEVESTLYTISQSELQRKIEKYSDRLTIIDSKLERLTNKQSTLRTSLRKVDDSKKSKIKLGQYEQQLEELVGTLAPVPEDIDTDALGTVHAIRSSVAVCAHTLTTLETKLENTRTLSDVCPINKKECPVHVPTKYKDVIVKELKKDIKKQNKEIEVKSKELNSLTSLSNLITNNTRVEKEIDRLEELIELTTEQLDSASVSKSVEEYAGVLSKVLGRIDEYKAKKERLKTKITMLFQELGTRESNEKTILMLRDRVSVINNALISLNDKYDQIKKIHDTGVDSLTVFKKLKLFKIDSIIEILNKETSKILQTISDGAYDIVISSQKMSSDNKRALDKINIIVSDGYKQLPVEMWSGGQITEVSLAIILGTWKAAAEMSSTSVSSLWLDEVFGPIDAKAVDRVFESVVNICEMSNVSSVFVVSHRDLDDRLFDNTITATQSNGISKITTTQ